MDECLRRRNESSAAKNNTSVLLNQRVALGNKHRNVPPQLIKMSRFGRGVQPEKRRAQVPFRIDSRHLSQSVKILVYGYSLVTVAITVNET